MTRISASRISMEDGRIDRAVLKDYGESCVGGASGTNTGTSYTVNLESGNVFNLILTGNCTFTFSNPPAAGTLGSFVLILKQDATGGRTATWPATVAWPAGTAPTLTTDASKLDVFSFATLDGGETWFGSIMGFSYT